MADICLREARPADADAIGRVHVTAWRETYAGLLPADMLASLSAPERAAMWADVIANPANADNNRVFVVERGGEIVGFGACGRQRDQALAARGFDNEIGAVYLLAAAQGLGAGRSLMRALAQAAGSMGARGASLWVLDGNQPARRFYEGLGGIVIAERAEQLDDASLTEIAYGWPEIARLAQAPHPP